ncbi:MAG: 16S rRNA (guanine(966)-N(2))-methyltransferase RsmD [Gammaproteobacteria bacterium]|nr:16S rRNA (guanine(966)-N(2))-methyltransferase RsmD [Gammaproteobacteria bacterium]
MAYAKKHTLAGNGWRRNRRNRTGHVRIIAGEWRGRRLAVASRPQLRPTPSRLRETLFNWLGDSIRGCRVLDLYAGSGILGFEALSRGADHATFVDIDKRTLTKLRDACQTFDLAAADASVVEANALQWLERDKSLWDLVFVDPPFHAERHYARILSEIVNHLTPGGVVYVESSARAEALVCPLHEWKSKNVGEVRIQLFTQLDETKQA